MKQSETWTAAAFVHFVFQQENPWDSAQVKIIKLPCTELPVDCQVTASDADPYGRDLCLLPFFIRKHTICDWKYPFVVLVQSDNQRAGKSANQCHTVRAWVCVWRRVLTFRVALVLITFLGIVPSLCCTKLALTQLAGSTFQRWKLTSWLKKIASTSRAISCGP